TRRDSDAGRPSRAARVGPGTPPHRIELLLVPARSRRQLLRVLQRPGLHHLRRPVETVGRRRRTRPLQLGPAPSAVLHPPGGPGRADERIAQFTTQLRHMLPRHPPAEESKCALLECPVAFLFCSANPRWTP